MKPSLLLYRVHFSRKFFYSSEYFRSLTFKQMCEVRSAPTSAKLKLELKLRPTKWSICLQCHSRGLRISINTSSGLCRKKIIMATISELLLLLRIAQKKTKTRELPLLYFGQHLHMETFYHKKCLRRSIYSIHIVIHDTKVTQKYCYHPVYSILFNSYTYYFLKNKSQYILFNYSYVYCCGTSVKHVSSCYSP